jgi:hypothetical protein
LKDHHDINSFCDAGPKGNLNNTTDRKAFQAVAGLENLAVGMNVCGGVNTVAKDQYWY